MVANHAKRLYYNAYSNFCDGKFDYHHFYFTRKPCISAGVLWNPRRYQFSVRYSDSKETIYELLFYMWHISDKQFCTNWIFRKTSYFISSIYRSFVWMFFKRSFVLIFTIFIVKLTKSLQSVFFLRVCFKSHVFIENRYQKMQKVQ